MIDFIRQRKLKILAVLLTTFIVVCAGYFFAAQKSKPYYEKKIDKIMFDTQNKSPKYVITLPDKDKRPTKKQKEEKTPEEKLTVENLSKVIPLISKLSPLSGQKPSNVIEPDADLYEEQDGLILPKISNSGKKPWMNYANEVKVLPNYYRVGIVIKNLGLDTSLTAAAIQALPENVSLSFSPYAFTVVDDIKKAREAGHETYVDLLLPSKDYLKSDTGPMSLDLTSSLEENKQRFLKVLNHKAAIGGVIINDGVADESNREQLAAIIEEMQKRGILMVDSTQSSEIESIKTQNLARKKADIVLDDKFSREKVRNALKAAENIARENGNVLIAMSPKPVVLLEISDWLKTFSPQLSYEEAKNQTIDRPFVLVPISNLVVE